MMYHKIKTKTSKTLNLMLEDDKERIALWLPVIIGCGVGVYFSLSHEPDFYYSLAALLITGLILGALYRSSFKLIALGFFLISLGFFAAKYRTDSVNNPMISKAREAEVYTAKIVSYEHRQDDVRLTMQSQEGNFKFRVVLRKNKYPKPMIKLGDTIKFSAILSPPSGPLVEYGYNFRLQSYFKGLSAVGIIKSVPEIISQEPPSFRDNLRSKINEFFRTSMNGDTGGIAAALVTGDRSGITKYLRNSFSDSGLAHILAISGLHLSIIAGLIFFVIRRLLSLIPKIALDYPTKKIAAFISILVTAFYLYLCWESVSAARAFIMTSVIMLAIIIDRDAITLRNVAIAATVLLLLMPESLLGPSFQLSFAAVIAIVSLYEYFKPNESDNTLQGGVAFITSILMSSVAASIVTMPYTIYTFNRFSLVGVITNIVAIPLMSFLIMPLLLVLLILMPFGLEAPLAYLLDLSLKLLISIADFGEGIKAGVVHMPEMTSGTLIVITLSTLWMVIWRTKIKYGGLVGITVASVMYFSHPKAEIFIAPGGKQVGVYDNNNLIIIGHKSTDFVSSIWLANLALAHPAILHKENYYHGNHYDIKINPEERIDILFKQKKPMQSLNLKTDDKQTYIIKATPRIKLININEINANRPWSTK